MLNGYRVFFSGTLSSFSSLSQAVSTDPYGQLANLDDAVAIGIEYSFSWSFQSTFVMSILSNQIRAYLKWKPGGGGIFSLAVLGGGTSDRLAYAGIGITENRWFGMAGARVTLLFLYGEYAMIFYPSEPRSAFTFGVAFKK